MTRRRAGLGLLGIAVAVSVGALASAAGPRHGGRLRPEVSPAASVAAPTRPPDQPLDPRTPTAPPDQPLDRRAAATVYVSCHGDDRNAGGASTPLRTPGAALRRPLPAGTTVLLQRGCTWPGRLELRGAGTAAAPIVLGAYGTGPDPVVSGAAAPGPAGLVRLLGPHQVVRDLRVTAGRGPGIEVRGPYAAVRAVTADHVGIGVLLAGTAGSASGVHASDLHLVVDTPGGDDDYGAIGFDVEAAGVEISGSSCVHCRAPSHDYGFDGGFAEIWNYGDGLDIHDNTGRDTDGILEVGGDRPDASARGVRVRDNRFEDAHGGFVVHDTGRFGIAAASLAVSGNTIVNTSAADGPVLSGQIRGVRFDGNRVTTAGLVSASGPPAGHRCNVYQLTGPGRLGFGLDATERLHGAPANSACRD